MVGDIEGYAWASCFPFAPRHDGAIYFLLIATPSHIFFFFFLNLDLHDIERVTIYSDQCKFELDLSAPMSKRLQARSLEMESMSPRWTAQLS